ncbi:ABC transporter ATP-binding protein [Thalassospira povalilytica]|uniref:ABC transporter ATP-binding protein n=1 Tax=Thalassospira povalilytica TaxID=732237 RepID=UPI003AA80160
MSSVSLFNVTKSFGTADIIKGVDLSIRDGELVVFVGPSGCGKSTLLRMISGLEEITAGEIHLGDKRVDHLPASDRDIAMVFQSYALYPHMTVAENIGFPLKMAGWSKSDMDAKTREIGDVLQLLHLFDRTPKQLSGGQRQRVAIGRALARDPKIILLDEPLSNLDAALRVDMRMELARLHRELGATMIYVTHDQVEAMTMADRIVVLRDGIVEQVGTPLDLYLQPANRFVAGFIGSPKMNFWDAHSDENGRVVMPSGLAVAMGDHVAANRSLTVGARPEHLVLCDEDNAALKGTVLAVEHLGSDTFVQLHCGIGDPSQMDVNVRLAGIVRVSIGDQLALTIADQDNWHLFDGDGIRLDPPADRVA